MGKHGIRVLETGFVSRAEGVLFLRCPFVKYVCDFSNIPGTYKEDASLSCENSHEGRDARKGSQSKSNETFKRKPSQMQRSAGSTVKEVNAK